MDGVKVCNENGPWLEMQLVFFCASLSSQNSVGFGSVRSVPNALFVYMLSSMSLLKPRANSVLQKVASCRHLRERNSGFSWQV